MDVQVVVRRPYGRHKRLFVHSRAAMGGQGTEWTTSTGQDELSMVDLRAIGECIGRQRGARGSRREAEKEVRNWVTAMGQEGQDESWKGKSVI